jgi:acetyl esterase/lipase
MSRAVAIVIAGALAAGSVAACGSAKHDAGPKTERIVRIASGSGAVGVYVFRRADLGTRRLPVVLFVHGWGGVDPRIYGAWIDHLAQEGNEVIYPRYQDSALDPPASVLGNLVLGVRRALRIGAAPVDTSTLVAVGHSAGGALIADYAGAAGALGLPHPLAIAPIFPGRAIGPTAPEAIPEIPGSRIPAATRILAYAGSRDRVVGTRWARRIVDTATRVPRDRKTLRIVRTPAVDYHDAVASSIPLARATFWAPVDALIRTARDQ